MLFFAQWRRIARQPSPVVCVKFCNLVSHGIWVQEAARRPTENWPNGSSPEVGLLAATIKQPVSSIPVFCVRVKDSYPDTCALRSSSRESLCTKPWPASNNSLLLRPPEPFHTLHPTPDMEKLRQDGVPQIHVVAHQGVLQLRLWNWLKIHVRIALQLWLLPFWMKVNK